MMKFGGSFAVGILAATMLSSCKGEESAPPPRYSLDTGNPDQPQNKFGFQEAIQRPSLPSWGQHERTAAESVVAAGIRPQAAPGVAFSYGYSFVLPDNAIASVQEQHATACEQLGPTKCRITGMRYTLVRENQVEAYMQFKLAPDLARAFGKSGIAAVQKAAGKLVDAVITGRDIDAEIRQSQARSEFANSQIAGLKKDLGKPGLSSDERSSKERELAELNSRLTTERTSREESSEALANTPMTFTYSGEHGFSLDSHPLRDSGRAAGTSLTAMVAVILLIGGYLLPWLVLAALLAMAWRSRPMRKLRGKDVAKDVSDETSPDSAADPQ